MAISSAVVKELREKTGAGMMDCKKALEESKGDINAAMDILRKRGIAKAEKRTVRRAAEGMIGHAMKGGLGVLVEVNCETDFVAKNDDFREYVRELTDAIAESRPKSNEEALLIEVRGRKLGDRQTELMAKIGENLGLRRFAMLEAGGGEKIAQYIHSNNKIASMVIFTDPNAKLDEKLAREVAMHVTAMAPRYTRAAEVPPEVVAREKEIIKAQMGETNKPSDIVDKIVAGKLGKYLSEICLDDQIFVCDLDGKRTVASVLSSVDPAIKVRSFVRLQVGEDM